MQLLPKSPRVGLPMEYERKMTEAGVRIGLIEDYHRSIGENLYVKCAKGTVSNFATIPSICHAVFKPEDPIIAIAAVVHDTLVEEFTTLQSYSLYSLNKDLCEVPIATRVSWDTAAGIFELIMIETAISLHQYNFANRRRIAAAVTAVRMYDFIR